MRSLLLTSLTLAGSAASFGLQVVLTRTFGVGAESDRYFAAVAAPLFCVGLFAAQATFGVVPALMNEAAAGPARWAAAAESYLRASAVAAAVVGVGGAALSLALRTHTDARGASAALTCACWAYGGTQILLTAWIAVAQSRRLYYRGALAVAVPPSVAAVLLLVWPGVTGFGVTAVPLLMTVATLGTCMFLSRGAEPRAERGSHDPGTRRFGLLQLARSPITLVTLAGFSVYSVVDAALLPALGDGVLTSAALSHRVVIGVGQLALIAPMTLVTHELVASLAAGDEARFRESFVRALSRVTAGTTALALVLWVAASPLLSALLASRHGASDVALAAVTLRRMLPGMVAMQSCVILVRTALAVPHMRATLWWLGPVWIAVYASCLFSLWRVGDPANGWAYSAAWMVCFCLSLARVRAGARRALRPAAAAAVALSPEESPS